MVFARDMSEQREKVHREVVKVKHHSIFKKNVDDIKELESLVPEVLHALCEMKESNEIYPTI